MIPPVPLRPFLALLGAACLLALPRQAVAAEEDHPVEDAAKFKLHTRANPSLPTLYLVGDSTMKVGTPGQRGWGDELAPFFDPAKINVVNQAIGGRSSRTYQAEGRWASMLVMVRPGDYVIIQFGHNDPGPINDNFRARGTIRGGGEETQEIDNILTHRHENVHSFGWYMRKYANDVKGKGATPIILSLVPRNSWKDGKVVRATPNNYGQWALDAAKATGSAFVDHNEIIARALERLGPEKALPMFADGKLHASPEGAKLNASMAVSGLKGLPGNPFGRYFSPAAKDIPSFGAETGR